MEPSRIAVAKSRVPTVQAITGMPRPLSAAVAVTLSLAEPLEGDRSATHGGSDASIRAWSRTTFRFPR
jgi:hypothetical protein